MPNAMLARPSAGASRSNERRAAPLSSRTPKAPEQTAIESAVKRANSESATTAGSTQTAASSTGVAAAYPSCATTVLLRAPESQRVFTSYGTGGFVIDRLWPHASVYEYGESISLGTTVFADYLRIAAGAQTSPTAMQLLDASRTTAVLFPRSDLTAELDAAPGWSRVLGDHGMLLYVRGDASWAAGAACSSSAAHTG